MAKLTSKAMNSVLEVVFLWITCAVCSDVAVAKMNKQKTLA